MCFSLNFKSAALQKPRLVSCNVGPEAKLITMVQKQHQRGGESQRATTLQSPAFRQKPAQGDVLAGNVFLKILEEQ